jgi:hypothetical protein
MDHHDGVALVDDLGNTVQFLSHEGSFAAVGGAADGITSTDVGVSEGSSMAGYSLRLMGIGSQNTDFTWQSQAADTGRAEPRTTLGGCN